MATAVGKIDQSMKVNVKKLRKIKVKQRRYLVQAQYEKVLKEKKRVLRPDRGTETNGQKNSEILTPHTAWTPTSVQRGITFSTFEKFYCRIDPYFTYCLQGRDQIWDPKNKLEKGQC